MASSRRGSYHVQEGPSGRADLDLEMDHYDTFRSGSDSSSSKLTAPRTNRENGMETERFDTSWLSTTSIVSNDSVKELPISWLLLAIHNVLDGLLGFGQHSKHKHNARISD
ncbi:hypothetical protein E2C01_001157 [Portunus trituberculatus]|uniref:Uncharacterized protein n=1 Tax=Portunus trituberculatus TaxID=210409 RepID=A0A5B7CGF2_PORTR|nr:hypothetical protein [Portunus trituberculatus]